MKRTGKPQKDQPSEEAFDWKGNMLYCLFFLKFYLHLDLAKGILSLMYQCRTKASFKKSYADLPQKFGSTGAGNSQFKSPQGIAVGLNRRIYIVDCENHRVCIFNPSLKFYKTFGSPGNSSGEFNSPIGIAMDNGGNLYISDTDNDRVQIFNEEGEYLSEIGTSGSAPGQLSSPTGIAVSRNGHVLVSEYNNDRVSIFDNKRIFIASIGNGEGTENGQFTRPMGIALDTNENIYVADYYNHRVQVFTWDRVFLRIIGGDHMLKYPNFIVVDGGGRIAVVCWGNRFVSIFDELGDLNFKFGDFEAPVGIAMNENSALIVADRTQDCIRVFE